MIDRTKRLAFSSNAFLHFPFTEAARVIRETGYDGIEIMADVPHAWPTGILEPQVKEIAAALEKHDLQISNINAFMMNAINDYRQKYWHPSWIEPYEPYRQVRINHTMKALDLAKALGSPCITTEPGGPLPVGQSWEDGLKLFLEGIKPVAEHAHKLGVHLLVEPEPDLLIETAAQFEQFMDQIDCPAIGLNFDIGHSYCVKDDPAATIPRLSKYIRHFHLEDIAESRVHQHLIPGEGAIDFGPCFQAMDDMGYNGWVTIELYPYVDNPENAARLARERVIEILK